MQRQRCYERAVHAYVMHKLKRRTRSLESCPSGRTTTRNGVCESYTQKDPNGRPSPASFALTPSTAWAASGVSMLCRDSCRAFGLLEKRKRKHDSVQYVYALHVGRGRVVRSNAGLGLRSWNIYIYRVLVSRKLEADSVYPVTVRSGLLYWSTGDSRTPPESMADRRRLRSYVRR